MTSHLIGKDPDAGKDGGQEEMRAAEGEMAGWHHQFSVHQSKQTLGDSKRQGSKRQVVYGVAKSQTELTD